MLLFAIEMHEKCIRILPLILETEEDESEASRMAKGEDDNDASLAGKIGTCVFAFSSC